MEQQDNVAASSNEKPSLDLRKPWVRPALERISAGSAENAVAPVDDDGVNKS